MRRIGWIALSLALHGLILLLVLLAKDSDKTNARRPLELTLVQPKPVPPKAPVAAPVVRRTNKPAVVAAAPTVTPSEAPSTATPNVSDRPTADRPTADRPTNNPDSPKILKLSDGALIGLAGPARKTDDRLPGAFTDFGDDGLDEKTRVEQRLKQGIEGFIVAQDTKSGARGTVASLRRALRESFEPVSTFVQKIPGSDKAKAQVAKNQAEAMNRPQSTTAFNNGLVPSQAAMQPTFGDPCAQSHEIGRLEARFRVDHDTHGQAEKWSLQLSSGDEAFDGYAKDVLRKVTTIQLKAHPDEAIPLYSEWALSQIVYDWNSNIFCPATERPPGLPVFADRKQPYSVTYSAEIALVTVRYRR